MQHIHLESCNSTQQYLIDNLEELYQKDKNIIISTSLQTGGIGRNENRWDSLQNGIAFSFTISPCPDSPTMTPLEIGVGIINFFRKQGHENLALKWPNDIIINEEKKCGGIICRMIDENTIIAGIGINLGKINSNEHLSDHAKFPAGSVTKQIITEEDRQAIPVSLVNSILNNRFSANEIKQKWEAHCMHLGIRVSLIRDDDQSFEGTFCGISESGTAIIKQDNITKEFSSGTLEINQ